MPETTAAQDIPVPHCGAVPQDYSIQSVVKEGIGAYVGEFDAQKNRRRNYRPIQVNVVFMTNQEEVKQWTVQVCDYLAPGTGSKTGKTSRLYVVKTEENEDRPMGFLDRDAMVEMLIDYVALDVKYDEDSAIIHGTVWISLERSGLWSDLAEVDREGIDWTPSGKYGYANINDTDSNAVRGLMREKLKRYLDLVSCSVA